MRYNMMNVSQMIELGAIDIISATDVRPGRCNAECDNCTIGMTYDNDMTKCPLCGCMPSTDDIFISYAGYKHCVFSCGTIINVCNHDGPNSEIDVPDTITSVVIGRRCREY